MINGLEGIPGSGKSYEAVVYHVLPMLQQGRKVITNLPLLVEVFAAIDPAYVPLIELRRRPRLVMGTWNADAMDDSGTGNAFQLQADVSLHHAPSEGVSVFGHVWDFYSTWKHPETGQGPIFIIDECHLALPVLGTDKQVVEWFKLHRHFNADVLLMTQSFRDINQPIARLMGMLIKCRKADILGKKDHYIRKVHAGYRGAVISTEERPYKAQYFGLYKSHTQGNSVSESAAQDVMPLNVKIRRFTWGFWLFAFVVIAWMYWPKGEKVQKTSEMQWVKDLNALPPGQILRASSDPAPSPVYPASLPVDQKQAEPEANPEPYSGKGLHLTGQMTMRGQTVYTFAVSTSGQRIGSIDSRDLVAAGYTWHPLTDCAGTLRYKNSAQAITCDAPILTQGAQDRPVVIEAGRSSREVHSAPGVASLPMPEFPAQQSGQITQSDIPQALALRRPSMAEFRPIHPPTSLH